MKPIKHQRVSITSTEAGYLTLGSWNGITEDFEITGYCHECDDIDAVLMVANYFLDLEMSCVTAEGSYKCCGNESIISFGILNRGLIEQLLAMLGKNH